ncbi:MAG TPA: hypothetical protein VGA27_07990 [Candidatus Binatia bacterium]
MNVWESVFTQSRVNDGYYDEDRLPDFRWEWPKRTWFQTRLDYARNNNQVGALKTSRKLRQSHDLPAM